MNPTIVPSIIAKEQKELEDLIRKAEQVGILMQLDIMDGNFVPNNSLDFDFKFPTTTAEFEAHMMVNDPIAFINRFKIHATTLIPHIESTKDPKEVISMIKGLGKRVGFALNPKTSLESISPYLDEIDQVIVMTVEPGFYGSKFVPETLEKVRELRRLRPGLDIEVDGSMNPATIRSAFQAGANKFVVGSFLMKSDNINEAFSELNSILNNIKGGENGQTNRH